MKSIPLTDKEIAEDRRILDSFNNLVYDKKEVKKCVDSYAGRKSTSIKAGYSR
jgi:hypothetical protein